MAIITPTINKIIRMTQFDLLRTAIKPGNMYMCIDSQVLYYDETTTNRVPYKYQGVKTVNDLLHNITPAKDTTYYCWEDNSLWLWMNKWITLWSDKTYPSAYVYDDNHNINAVYRYDQPLLPADDNGLLKDGSVVVRDRQRIIKGKIYIDDGNDNFVISSFLGGGVKVLPNGLMDTDGEFFIGDEGKSFLRSEFSHLNNETYVDYTEHPELDKNPHANSTHRYMIFHEGNLDASKVREITPLEIYNKLLDKSLPSPLEFNVKKLNGKLDTDFASATHTHKAKDITDFNTTARSQALIEIKSVFNSLLGEGITVSPNGNGFKLTADTFNLSFGGGVTGSGTIEHLTDTTINLTVDPTKHTHKDLQDSIKDLQDDLAALSSINPDEYYKKDKVDQLISGVSGTVTPTPGKPLLVDKNGILPGPAESASKLTNSITMEFIGDVTGITTTDFSSDLQITLNADNILSTTPTPGKGLKVDSTGTLPGNALTSSALDHNIVVSLVGDVTGSATLDTSKTTFELNTTIQKGDILLTEDEIGVKVPGLDANGKIPTSQLPDDVFKNVLTPMGTFAPADGLPSSDPKEGYFWTASQPGDLEGYTYQEGDWIVYLNSGWSKVNVTDDVFSVNNKTGKVVLTYDDVGAISATYIDYTLGNTIPGNKIVRTQTDGRIVGATVDKLTKEFKLLNDAGDIEFASNSTNIKTDGSKDLKVKMNITSQGYDNILEQVGHIISNDGAVFSTHRQYLNFTGDVTVTESSGDNAYNVNIGGVSRGYLIYVDESYLDELPLILSNLWDTRAEKPIVIVYGCGSVLTQQNRLFVIDSRCPELTEELSTIRIVSRAPTSILTKDATSSTEIYDVSQAMMIYSQDMGITSITVSDMDLPLYKVLTTDKSYSTPFIPTQPYQPATKKYVDQQDNHKLNVWDTDVSISGHAVTFTINKTEAHNFTYGNIAIRLKTGIPNSNRVSFTVDKLVVNTTSGDITTTKTYYFTDTVYMLPGNGTDSYYAGDVLLLSLGKSGTGYNESFIANAESRPKSGMIVYTIGDGTKTSYTLTHNKECTTVIVQARSSAGKEVIMDSTIVDANTVEVSSDIAIPAGTKIFLMYDNNYEEITL